MTGETFLNFAYGSNMLTARIRERCPSASPVGVAELSGHTLRWRKSSSNGSGKCDIVVSGKSEDRVFGVLYEVNTREKEALDEAEGLGKGYEEIEVPVVCKGKRTRTKAYRATSTCAELVPYTWYRAFVIAGAREHGLPTDYIESLSAVVAREDANRERHSRNMHLIPEALR